MKINLIHKNKLQFWAMLLLLALQSCESTGQKSYDESDWSGRRKIPPYIVQELPSTPYTLGTSDHFKFHGFGENDPALTAVINSQLEKSAEKIEAFSQRKINSKKISVFYYPSPEVKGLILKNSKPCQVDFEKNEIHLVVNDIFKDYYLAFANELILKNIFDTANSEIFQTGLAIYLSENWQKNGYQFWASKLMNANQLPSINNLLNIDNWKHSSDIIFGAAAASLCEFLVDNYGKKDFLEKYLNNGFDFFELNHLENSWKNHISNYSIEESEKNTENFSFLKGFNFAHEGYRIYNGYGSKKATQSLQHQKNIEANAVAVVPYSFTRYPKKPHPIPVVKRTGTENDESVIQSSEEAQNLGLKVILKPQIWIGRGMWTGDIEMLNKEDWNVFFEHYGHWISHYAIMSEIYDWEVLCIGTELVQTTLQQEQSWKDLIHDLRALYNGQLTYAANWGDEFENIGFWSELDFIGLNCYYPLSHKENPSDRELAKGFDAVISKIERVFKKYKKPIVFTEIGFPCIESPWKEPHNDWGEFIANAEHQRRCYEIVFNGIRNKEWCKGIFWWKYPSDLEQKRRRNTGFTPHGNPAEQVVAKWFSQLN